MLYPKQHLDQYQTDFLLSEIQRLKLEKKEEEEVEVEVEVEEKQKNKTTQQKHKTQKNRCCKLTSSEVYLLQLIQIEFIVYIIDRISKFYKLE